MTIAIIAHDNKKELIAQFCTAYAGILARHRICATSTTGAIITQQTGLPIKLYMMGAHGGSEQIGARIAYNEIDLVIHFHDPGDPNYADAVTYLSKLCDQNNIPYATNAATAEAIILALDRGDLDWRDNVNPKGKERFTKAPKAMQTP